MMKNLVMPSLSATGNCGNVNPYQVDMGVPLNSFASVARTHATLHPTLGRSPVGWNNPANAGPQAVCSEDMPEVVWKTIPCWYFVKNKGDCPHGASCTFVHDASFHMVVERDREREKKSGKISHCWAYVQGGCWRDECSYLHPKDIRPYVPYTPCAKWWTCEHAPYCEFQHPIWVYTRGIIREKGKIARSIYFEALATIQGKPVEYCGTTYFPLISASDAEDWRQTMNKSLNDGNDMNNGLFHTSLADSTALRNSIETPKGRFTVQSGSSKHRIAAQRMGVVKW